MVALNLTAAAAAASLFNVMSNFTGRVLDLSFSTTTNLDPIILDASNGGGNQKWLLVETNQGTFQVQNALGPFLSVPVPSARLNWTSTVSQSSAPLNFIITPSSVGASSVNILEQNSRQALTAWSTTLAPVSPVTFSPLNLGAIQQIWTLIPG